MEQLTQQQVSQDISTLKTFWSKRNKRFEDWFTIIWLIDTLATKNMETYVSNEPATFFNMAHYLLTKGDISHTVSVESESALELDRRARVDRACKYMWKKIDRERQLGGGQPFIDELGFFLLVLGWYSTVLYFDKDTGLVNSQIWNPADVFPRFANNKMVACVHSYKIQEAEARLKAEENDWNYNPSGTSSGDIQLDDYFATMDGVLYNMVLLGDKDVTGWVERPEMALLVAPVGGYPDKGSLTPKSEDWRGLAGRGIFEVNTAVSLHVNKWKSMISQILRDTAQPITQEFSASPQATPETLRERGAFFHFAPGEQGLMRLPPPALPIEIQANLVDLKREQQKGSFNDAVFGMVEGQPGYALSLLATSSANQILYPYMDGKHFVLSETDRFWLSQLKTSKRVFEVKDKFIEKLNPKDIPEDVTVDVSSDVATPKDWLERGTIGGMLRQDLDEATLLKEIYKFSDPQAIKRAKGLDRVLNHPTTQNIELIAGYYKHADYLTVRGDRQQAEIFRKAAVAMEAQFGAPEPGQGSPLGASEVQAAREEGTPSPVQSVASRVSPPEARAGFTPQQLRQTIGRGQIRRV